MFVIFLLFQRNLFVVLASGKVLKIAFKEPCYPHQGSALDPLECSQQPFRPQAAIYTPYVHYWDTKEISFCYFCNTKLCANYSWDHVCKLNEWCIVNCFHHKFRVSTPIMVCDYSIAKCKTFSACGWLLMAFQAIFFRNSIFYINSNPTSLLI